MATQTMRQLRRSKRALSTGTASLAVAALAVAGVMTSPVEGTASAAGPFSGVTITMLYGTPAPGSGAVAWTKYMQQQFHSQTGGQLKYQFYSNPSEEITDLDAIFASHTGADIVEFGSTVAPIGLKNHGFLRLTNADWNAVGGRSRFFPSSIKLMGPSPSADIAVPEYVFPYEILYNTALFKRAGIASPPATWAQYLADAKKVTALGNGIFGTALEPVGSSANVNWKIIYLLTREYGGQFLNKSGDVATMNTSAVHEATEFYMGWLTKYHIVPPASVSWTDANDVSAFASGKIGMLPVQGPGTVSSFKGQPIGSNYAYAPFPQDPPGSTAKVIIPGYTLDDVYSVSNYSSNKAAALKAVEIFTSKQSEIVENKDMGVFPANQAAAKVVAEHSSVIRQFVPVVPKTVGSPFSVVWGDVEAQVPAVLAELGSDIASGSYSSVKVNTYWSQANKIIQQDINASNR